MTTILCIEDEAYLREEIAGELADTGYDVLQAADGNDGLEMILKHEPDLVICDITMPRKNGHQLLNEIRARNGKFSRMSFIFLSSLGEVEHVIAGLKLGADDYLTKPVDLDLLLVTVENALKRVKRILNQGNEARNSVGSKNRDTPRPSFFAR